MNSELFLKKINEYSRFRVNIDFIEWVLSSNINKKQRLHHEIATQIPELNIDSKKTIKSYLVKSGYNIDKVTQTGLKELYSQTGNQIFDKLANYYKLDDKVSKIQGFMKNCVEESEYSLIINPVFALNSSGGTSISKPSLPFSIYEIKSILRFTTAINFNSMEEIIDFLKKYKGIIVVTPDQSNFLILNMTLYLEMIDSFDALTPVELVENKQDIVEDLVNKFYQEFYEVEPINKFESIGKIYSKIRTASDRVIG